MFKSHDERVTCFLERLERLPDDKLAGFFLGFFGASALMDLTDERLYDNEDHFDFETVESIDLFIKHTSEGA